MMDGYRFREHFEQMSYKGTSAVGTLNALGQSNSANLKGSTQKGRTTIKTVTSSSSQWESNVLERLRVLIAASTKSLQEIFNEFDEDGNGYVTLVEFRNAIRRLGLGVTSRDLDSLMHQIDRNGDGKIDWLEFSSKFKGNSYDSRMAARAANRMAKLKELMNLHMTSANDAFHFVSFTYLTINFALLLTTYSSTLRKTAASLLPISASSLHECMSWLATRHRPTR